MLDAETIIHSGGLLLLVLMAFGQTGLFFCFFLPVGGLVFTTGVLMATGSFNYNPVLVCSLLILATIAGNISGYWFGRRTGPLLYQRQDSRFFHHRHLVAAENFYERHGNLALIAGVLLPLIRAFAPIVSGIIKMNRRRYLLFTSVGAVVYVVSFTMAGYLIGSVPALQPYLEYLVGAIIVFVSVPVIVRIIREFRKKQKLV